MPVQAVANKAPGKSVGIFSLCQGNSCYECEKNSRFKLLKNSSLLSVFFVSDNLQIPLLKSHSSVRQFKLAKDGQEDSTGDLHQWFKRKQSVWPTETANAHNEKVVRSIFHFMITLC